MKASSVICDGKVPHKLKGKIYRITIRPALLYGTKYWAIKGQHEHKWRIFCWMSGQWSY